MSMSGAGRSQGVRVTRAELATSTCILCGEPSLALGCFFPNEPQRFGAPEGKKRMILYGLCSDHYSPDGEYAERIENQILEDLAR
jgi:hypothetical protein